MKRLVLLGAATGSAALIAIVIAACGGAQKKPASFDPVSDKTNFSGDAGATGGECVKSGCSGTVCTEPGNEMVTTCEMKPEYACYQSATCERQPDGACGWTQTDELTACLASPPPLQ